MKKTFDIALIIVAILIVGFVGFSLIAVSAMGKRAQQNRQYNTENIASNFNLEEDYSDFKTKMTELDTIKVYFDHSVCTYQGYEKIEITKHSELIKIKSVFNSIGSRNWELIYEHEIPPTDTIWKFGQFIERNKTKWNSDKGKRDIIQISYKTDTIGMQVNGLVELNHFLADYYSTMRELHLENKNNIYGYDIVVPE